jgi:hypothetical protein
MCYYFDVFKSNESEQNWFIGIAEVEGYRIPLVGRGVTRQEAEREALQRVAKVQANYLEPGGELELDLSG